MELLTHKGYHGSIETSLVDKVLHGKILFIEDLVTYEAENIAQLENEFVAAVEDYLETCAAVGKAPQKSCSGQFNVRVPPELHRLAQIRAAAEATNLNNVVISALEKHLNDQNQTVASVTNQEVQASVGTTFFVVSLKETYKLQATDTPSFIESSNTSSTSTFNIKNPLPTGREYAH